MGFLNQDETESHRYMLQQRAIAIGDDYFVKDEHGNEVLRIDGKALRLRDTWHVETPAGDRLFTIQERMLRIADTMVIEDNNGKTVASIHKKLISPLHDRWVIEREGADDLETVGNILDHDYQIKDGRQVVAEVSKKWLRVRDSYGVEIFGEVSDFLVVAMVVVIDAMAHGDRKDDDPQPD